MNIDDLATLMREGFAKLNAQNAELRETVDLIATHLDRIDRKLDTVKNSVDYNRREVMTRKTVDDAREAANSEMLANFNARIEGIEGRLDKAGL